LKCNRGYIHGVQWVLLSYRMPREPSTPRIAVWRKLKSFGVAQLGDGLVALPADARTREQLEWVAEDVEQAGGSAMLWTAHPESAAHERRIAAEMTAARTEEYRQLCEQATAEESTASVRRLRGALRRIERRDYFPTPERESARAAVQAVVERGAPERA
jgi:hypothetical protein